MQQLFLGRSKTVLEHHQYIRSKHVKECNWLFEHHHSASIGLFTYEFHSYAAFNLVSIWTMINIYL